MFSRIFLKDFSKVFVRISVFSLAFILHKYKVSDYLCENIYNEKLKSRFQRKFDLSD